MNDEIKRLLDKVLGPYQTKLDQASKKVEALGNRIDPILDKSMDDENPKYVCGDALEEIKEVIDDTAIQLAYAKKIVMAYVGAWGLYNGEDEDGYRTAYIHGYMNAIK